MCEIPRVGIARVSFCLEGDWNVNLFSNISVAESLRLSVCYEHCLVQLEDSCTLVSHLFIHLLAQGSYWDFDICAREFY